MYKVLMKRWTSTTQSTILADVIEHENDEMGNGGAKI
jgi:hypothetical protein